MCNMQLPEVFEMARATARAKALKTDAMRALGARITLTAAVSLALFAVFLLSRP
jgi:hypothetical protein